MRRKEDPLSRGRHRAIAGDLFNYTWSLLGAGRRTREEDLEMIHAAHASRYHWGHAGGLLNRSIGEWQISRVYAVLGRPEAAAYHARWALETARKGGLARFYVAYAYEALARAAATAGNVSQKSRYLKEARRFGARIRDSDDRRMLEEDLATIP